MNRPICLALAALLIGACAPKGDDSDGSIAADSTAMTDSIGIAGIDSAGAIGGTPPLTRRDSATKGTAATKATKSQTTGVIGRDSAFGPSFVIDSTGKMVPIPTKKP